MDRTLDALDWSMISVFLAVADTGSLSAAARHLGSSQPTVSRQVREIEEALQAELFTRQPRGMALTSTGEALLGPAREMREAAASFSLIAAGASGAISGTVRITASVMAAQRIMPAIISRIRQAEPDIQIELVATDDSQNLLFREADIAVRMYRPTQLDVITQHVGDVELGLYAAQTYLQRVGQPDGMDALKELDWVGYDTSDVIINGFKNAGVDVDRSFFAVRCDNNGVLFEMVREGCGLGFISRKLAQHDPKLQELDLGVPIPRLPVWLTAPQALRHSPRIKRVWDLLAEELDAWLS